MKHVISTTTAPGAVGPYSQAIEANGFVFVSGQLPLDPATGAFVPGGTSEQAEQSIKNLLAVHEIYATYFDRPYPARSTVQVGALPKGALVEIEAIAVKP